MRVKVVETTRVHATYLTMNHHLFQTLFKLRTTEKREQLEDYLTEILAHLLRVNDDLLHTFLERFARLNGAQAAYSVSTQTEFLALEHHSINSKPDMVIQSEHACVMIENKVGSSEGWEQLPRYADHLHTFPHPTKVLLYITRDFDPKTESEIVPENSGIAFYAVRWYEIARCLRDYQEHLLVPEVLTFMKHHHLTMNHQFSPSDIIALNNFTHVRAMLDECLNAAVTSRFKKLNNDGISRHVDCMTQLRDHDRYIYYASHEHEFWMGIGFYLNANNEKEYPEAVLLLEAYPNATKRDTIIQSFRQIQKDSTGWEAYKLNEPKAWSGIYKPLSLQSVLSSENHIQAIQTFFFEVMNEVGRMYPSYPRLAPQSSGS